MSIIEKAQDLGRALAESKELNTMREAEKMMMENDEARGSIAQFDEKQRAYQMIQAQGEQLTEGQVKELEELEFKMLNNPYVYNFFKAQQEFQGILESINNIIGEAIGVKQQGCGCEDQSCGCDGSCG
ncbi:YlbF family regulator [Pelotomaculum propionicicum]|uniref:YlbF family regulator n=1 Tax=Pelotomaculum propionicicum TaxID=258475 RepID=UPI003B81DF96